MQGLQKMAKATTPAVNGSEAPVAFKPKHPIVVLVSFKEARQLKQDEIKSLIPLLLALHSTKTAFDLATPSECRCSLYHQERSVFYSF